MKRVLSFALMLVVLLVPMSVFAAFPDVPEDHWAYGFIEELSGKGVINGFTDGTFHPSETLTRGQFLKLIITASVPNVDYDLVQADIDHWAAPYLKVAENYGVIEIGTVTKEMLDEPIPRIEVIKLLGLCDINIREHEQETVDFLDFTDVDNITSLENALLSHAVAKQIIGGYPDGTFKPENNLTRAEATKIISVYMSQE